MVAAIISSALAGFLAGIVITVFVMGLWSQRRETRQAPDMPKEPLLFYPIEQTFDNVMYRTEGSTILAVAYVGFADRTEQYLMKSLHGRYFRQTHNRYKSGSEDASIFPYTKEQAIRSYNHTADKRVSFEEAFGEKLIEA